MARPGIKIINVIKLIRAKAGRTPPWQGRESQGDKLVKYFPSKLR